jgi:hypothetical protein
MEVSVMNDIKLLALLSDYCTAQKNVVNSMYWAMSHFEQGRKGVSWEWLFYWCEDKDRRDELFNKLKNDYPRAMMMKEGYEV